MPETIAVFDAGTRIGQSVVKALSEAGFIVHAAITHNCNPEVKKNLSSMVNVTVFTVDPVDNPTTLSVALEDAQVIV